MSDGCNDLSFNWKRVLIFLVSQFILALNVLFVNWWNFSINCLYDVSFSGENDISSKITDLETSNRLGIINYSVSTLSFRLNVLIKLSINFIGWLAAINFLLIRSNSSLKFEVIFFARYNTGLMMLLLYFFGILASRRTESFIYKKVFLYTLVYIMPSFPIISVSKNLLGLFSTANLIPGWN